MAVTEVEIGTLRWPVEVSKRVQTPDSGVSLTESPANRIVVRANIVAVKPQTFLAGTQTDRPITHYIQMRWLGWLDETWVIQRRDRLPDGSDRIETYRIRRVKEIDGRKRFIEVEAELEQRFDEGNA
jgi:hypothetical protein